MSLMPIYRPGASLTLFLLAAPPSSLARRASVQIPSAPSLTEPEATKDDKPEEEDEEQSRRQTIAARFASSFGPTLPMPS